MIECETFLQRYSAFRDGDLAWAAREEMEQHLEACTSCAHYQRVLQRGTEVLRHLPELEVSEDFGERLRWRLQLAEHEERLARRRASPAQALGTLGIAAAVALAAWVPLMHGSPAPGRLPAVAAAAPRGAFFRGLTLRSLHQEATGLTSRLAQMGVEVKEMPYHEVVFREQGPLVGQLAAYQPPAAQPAPGALQP